MNSCDAAQARAISAEIFADDFVDHDGIQAGTRGHAAWQACFIDVNPGTC